MKAISRRDFLKGSAASALSLAVLGMGGQAFAEGEAPVAADETLETPILVVGAGAAGMMAAYEASKAGAKVLVISNSPSAMATNGAIVSGTCAVETAYTEEIGQDYSIEDLYRRMISFAHWTVNPRLLMNCVKLLPSNITTLEDMGIQVFLAGDRYGIGFNEVHIFLTENKWELAEKACLDQGVEFMYNMTAEAPIMDGDAVVGIRATDKDGKVYDIKAKAVLLACGGFMASKEKLAEHFGDIEVVNMGMPFNTGKGIDIAKQAGGFFERITGMGLNDIYGMNAKSSKISVFNSNPLMQLAFYGNLITDEHGDRFMNEYMLANEPMAGGGEATLHVNRYFCIYNEETLMKMKDEAYYQTIGAPAFWTSAATMFNAPIPELDANLEEALAEGWCYKADTLEELAEMTGCENLAETVRTYDSYVAAGEDPVFHKQAELMQPIGEEGPFYLFEYNPSAFNTFGGCRTDHKTRALKANFDVIPGLYIAGVENGSLYSSPYYDVGGTCNGLSLASGRLAGMEMAEYVKE
ncbi:MAG: FAD-binding protein [Eubacteriales bacterium]|nr:FAD-binding protein [Eubacteriales bacterium]